MACVKIIVTYSKARISKRLTHFFAGSRSACVCVVPVFILMVISSSALTYTVSTPGGDIPLEINHAGSDGGLVRAGEPVVPAFRPPSIFSAPLPSGSGARAFGIAGAFTAVADDATAASWNPAGLTQLERPEASFVLRYSHHDAKHYSGSGDYSVGEDTFDNANLNYLSAVYPFRALNRNMVFSINYQEAYDFEQSFTAKGLGMDYESNSQKTTDASSLESIDDEISDTESQSGTTVDTYMVNHVNTRVYSQVHQLLSSDTTLNNLEFHQEGIVDAITPAFAVDISPRISFGAACNFYQDDTMGYRPVQSTTRAEYSGHSTTFVSSRDQTVAEGTFEYTQVFHIPEIDLGGGLVIPATNKTYEGSGSFGPLSETSMSYQSDTLYYEGVYTEKNEFSELQGINATFGAQCSVTPKLTMGAVIDLPWTAEGKQKKVITTKTTTYTSDKSTVLDESETTVVEKKDVEFEFPLYWSLGAVWKWNNNLWSSMDVSQTQWSQFSYKAEGEKRINPLDGSPHGDNPLDDCWSVRVGSEYLWLLESTEIPIRAGLNWEQRPAIGRPDEFYGFSLGSGISMGKDPGKLIIDIAYSYMYGNDVLGSLVPDRPDVTTDMEEHQVYVSGIWHF